VAAQTTGTALRIFTAAELGSHFLFWENSQLFNEVSLFLSGPDATSDT